MSDSDSFNNSPGPEVARRASPGCHRVPSHRSTRLSLAPHRAHSPASAAARARTQTAPPRLIPNIGHVLVFILLLFPPSSAVTSSPFSPFTLPIRTCAFPCSCSKLAATSSTPFPCRRPSTSSSGRLPLSFSLSGGIARSPRASTGTSLSPSAGSSLLAALGVFTGLAITLAGNFLPMPKAPPILEDLTKSAAGAWTLMAFGVTLAPLTEELAFRGFLLPSLINIFRWFQRKQVDRRSRGPHLRHPALHPAHLDPLRPHARPAGFQLVGTGPPHRLRQHPPLRHPSRH